MTQTEPQSAQPYAVETQRDRWMKYGGNVALMSFVVIVIAVFAVAIAERRTKRIDTTSAGLYSLKQQTVNVIKDNAHKIQITSLYTKTKPGQVEDGSDGNTPSVADQAEKVADLLEEYKTKGKNIEIDSIDPIANPTKIDDLINDVSTRYGGQVDKYKAFAKSYPVTLKKLTTDAAAEAEKIQPMMDGIETSLKVQQAALQEVAKTKEPTSEQIETFNELATAYKRLRPIGRFLQGTTGQVQEAENVITKALKSKPPAYKQVADNAKETAGDLSANFASVTDAFKTDKDNPKMPEAARKYMTESLPRYEALKKQADDLVTEATALGELKLDTLREALRQRNSILVRGEKEWKIIPYEQVWRNENRSGASEAAKLKPRFAGEQMITTSILALQQPKKLKVAIVRGGGPPLAEPPIPFFRPEGGVLGIVADRLREYNYDVVEKDLTGMWAIQQMQQQQQQQMSAPEPTDAEIKDAVWIVVDMPGQQSQFGPPPTIAPKVLEHLANGGSAMILVAPRGDDMAAAIKDWGIAIQPEAMCVHERVKTEGAQGDLIEEVKKNPVFFEIRDWGDHPITSPMRSLPGIVLANVVVSTSKATGVKVTSIIPIPGAPNAPKSWGEKDLSSVSGTPTFDADKGDVAGPLFGGAAAEKEGGNRLVVIGAMEMMRSEVVTYPDPELAKKDIYVVRFPGNAELFANAVYWLSKQETMIAISPASMDVGRIDDLSRPMQGFWRIGVAIIGLPLAVIAAGVMVYFARRD